MVTAGLGRIKAGEAVQKTEAQPLAGDSGQDCWATLRYQRRHGYRKMGCLSPVGGIRKLRQVDVMGPLRRFAVGREKRKPNTMNKTESRYADELERRLRTGEIEWWGFEAIRLKLADNTTYTPDFMVLNNDGVIEFVEIKGYWKDDARVKIKVAASQYWMFRFVAIRSCKSGWEREEF